MEPLDDNLTVVHSDSPRELCHESSSEFVKQLTLKLSDEMNRHNADE